MRLDSDSFAAMDRSPAKSPRFVVKIEYSAVSLYVSSHSDISGVPTTHIAGCLIEPSIVSQKLNPDQGRAEIGAASFTVADRSSAFTDYVLARHAAGEGLRDKWCRFYLGYEGMAWSDFRIIGTQQIKEATFEKGAYRILCNDIQRSARKEIFDLSATTIASTVEATDLTINVVSTAGFMTYYHGASYSDAPSTNVGYLKIKDEVIRYTNITSTSFTNCTRGVLGTIASRYVADAATPESRREKVSEYVYLEMPGPKLAYALLTGALHGDAAELPTAWHLDIPTSMVILSDFTAVSPDLWDTSNDENGVVLRFEGLGKADGKAFIETEILRLLGLFMPVYATGEIGLRRMTRVLSDASGVVTLDESNSTSVGDLQHDMESLHNAFKIQWNWNGKDYTRTTTFVDASSAAKHGRGATMDLKFKGLYGGRHTDGMLFKLLDSIRDRFSGPPLRHRREVFHSLNRVDVGDVVRVRDPNVRDFTSPTGTLDRAFEVQSATVNHRTGAVALELFGSTDGASVNTPTGSTSALPDSGFYTAQGTNLTSVMTISSGVVSGGPYTLAGGTDLTTAGSTWYYDGNLTIGTGVTVNISGNVQLRVKGYLTINGTINGVGGGLAGVADNGTVTVIAGNAGWVGNSRGNDGVRRIDLPGDGVTLRTQAPALTQSKHSAFPYVDLAVNGTNLRGLPTDIRGTGGGPGGKVVNSNGTFYKNGGTGGAGGAGLCTISRGLGLGANAVINLSGSNTTAPTAHQWNQDGKTINVFPGAGGAGGPGGWLLLIDGGLLSVPDLSGRFSARTGIVGVPTYQTALSGTGMEKFKLNLEPFAGYLAEPSVISDLDLSFSASRIQYIPAPEAASADIAWPPPDVNGVIPDSNFSLSTGQDFWYWGTYTGVAISLTGGVSGGRLILTGNSTEKYVYSNRAPLLKAVTSQQFSVRVRWRRTGNISGTTSIEVAGLAVNAVPPSSSMSMAGNFAISSINSVTVNQWQESSGTLTVSNLPKNQTQLPFVTFLLYMYSTTTGGEIEISDFVVTPI